MRNLTFALILISCFALAQTNDDWKASTLQPGDVLSIQVFRVAEFSKVVRIEEDGTFRYPLCGTITASGQTARAIAEEIEKRLANAKQVQDPHVDVFVQDWGPRRIYILGEVKSSQSMELPTYGRMTALQALSAAGGFTESADLNNVAVLRRTEGKLIRHKIDVSALASRQSGGDDFKLLPEDTLIVPKAPPVFVAGEVNSPTTIFIDTQRPPLVSELIIRAGSMKSGADAGNICIIRTDAKGNRDMIPASLPETMCSSVPLNRSTFLAKLESPAPLPSRRTRRSPLLKPSLSPAASRKSPNRTTSRSSVIRKSENST